MKRWELPLGLAYMLSGLCRRVCPIPRLTVRLRRLRRMRRVSVGLLVYLCAGVFMYMFVCVCVCLCVGVSVCVLLLVLTALAVASQSVTPASTGSHASVVCAAPSYSSVSTRTSQQIPPTVLAGSRQHAAGSSQQLEHNREQLSDSSCNTAALGLPEVS